MRRVRVPVLIAAGLITATLLGVQVAYGQAQAPAPSPQVPGAPAPVVTPTAVNPTTLAVMGTGSASVALTFDDGPDPVNTPILLDLLKAQGVKATFCVVGHRARDNQAIIKRMFDEGHTICNHSWQHLQDLGTRSNDYIRKDLKATTKWIHRAAPAAKVQYFRAPYGNFSRRVDVIARSLGMTPLSWRVDDQCYLTATYGKGTKMVNRMISRVKQQTRPGSIILSHDMLKPWTVTAYRTLLPWLKEQFTLIPMPLVPAPPAPKPKPTVTPTPVPTTPPPTTSSPTSPTPTDPPSTATAPAATETAMPDPTGTPPPNPDPAQPAA